jgi:hypothetical protein
VCAALGCLHKLIFSHSLATVTKMNLKGKHKLNPKGVSHH